MKNRITLFLLFLLVNHKISAQSYVPVATTGYTFDAVAENTTAILTTTGPLDGVNVLYSAAYASLISSSYGLPNSGMFSSSTRTYQLQNYTGPNMLFIQPSGLDSLTFVTPVACQTLSLLDFATDAFNPTTMSVTIRFTDNTTQVFTGVTVYDWLYTSVTAFANGFDRLNRSAGTAQNEGGNGNPRFFTTDFPLSCTNQSKLVKRIIIKNTGTSNEKLCILAASAALMPLTVNALPANLCTGGSSTLTASGISNYTWLPVGGFSGATTTVVSVTPGTTTEYTVQALNSGTCMLSALVTINVYSVAPVLTLTNSANAGGICPTQSVMLTASGATTYSWTGGTTTVLNGVPFNPTIASDYTVTGTNACGSTTAAASVSVHPFPTVNPAASSSSICSGNSITLTATGNATNYAWAGGITSGAGFAPSLSATYTVIGTSALSCTASATIPVTVVATPSIAPTSGSPIVCIGKSATLTAIGATNYTWTGGSSVGNSSVYVVTPAGPGVTSYTVMRANANCTTSAQISVTTNSLPTIFAIVTPTLVCALNPATLAVGGGQTYTWTAPGPPSFTFAGASPVVSPPASGIYTVAASDGTCINTTTVYLATNPNPTITTSATSPSLCSGQSVTVTANGGINYTWTATSNSNTYTTQSVTDTPTIATSYNVTGDNSFGCSSGAGAVILVYPNPTISISVTKTLVCSSGPSTLTASGATSYTWDANANGALTAGTIVHPVNNTSGPVVFTVQGSYATGCQSSTTVQVSVFVPTLTITGNTNTCYGGNISLTAGGGNNNSYSWLTGTGNPYNFASITSSLTTPATWTLSATTTSAGVPCPATKTVGLGIYLNPTITAVAQRTTICRNETTQLYANGGSTYQWSNNMTNSTITIVSPGSGNLVTYTVTGTDANGCVGSATVQVKLSTCIGISELSNSNTVLSIYPNPNNGEFTIDSDLDLKLTLVNGLGQIVRTIIMPGMSQKINATDLAEGIYFLRGQNADIIINQKIIVAK